MLEYTRQDTMGSFSIPTTGHVSSSYCGHCATTQHYSLSPSHYQWTEVVRILAQNTSFTDYLLIPLCLDPVYFGDTFSYFVNNSFTTSFHSGEPITMNTTAAYLPTDTIYMARLKEGKEDFLKDAESLFLSNGFSYSGLHLNKPNLLLHSGNYETQLHVTSLFNGYECHPIYNSFISSSTYLGILNGIVILQSTMQRMAYYGKWLTQIIKSKHVNFNWQRCCFPFFNVPISFINSGLQT